MVGRRQWWLGVVAAVLAWSWSSAGGESATAPAATAAGVTPVVLAGVAGGDPGRPHLLVLHAPVPGVLRAVFRHAGDPAAGDGPCERAGCPVAGPLSVPLPAVPAIPDLPPISPEAVHGEGLDLAVQVGDGPYAVVGEWRRRDGRWGFRRAWPGGDPPTGCRRLLLAATCEWPDADPGRVLVKLACANAGEAIDRDYDLFLHVEPGPTGCDLAATTALGLYPMSVAGDSGAWRSDELTVAAFGPLGLRSSGPAVLYLRAGLYDRQGDGHRLAVAGPDDTRRALLGRLVRGAAGAWRFEPAPLGATVVPAGWSAAVAAEGRATP